MNRKMDEHKVFLSGQISGRDTESAKDHFKRVEIDLTKRGKFVLNPADNVPREAWQDYMRDSISQLVRCEAVVMLDDWQESKGATIERNLALELGLPVYYERYLDEYFDDYPCKYAYDIVKESK